jgi:hypothetical protein
MKATLPDIALLSAISGIGILCSGCQEKLGEDTAGESGGGGSEEPVVADLSDNLDLKLTSSASRS